MKKGLQIFLYLGLVCVLIYNIIIICKSFLYPNETPSIFGIKTFVVVSGSMEPELSIGDIVIVKEYGQNQLMEKDIISYREGQKIITHRIYSIMLVNGDIMYQTKGDNNNSFDSQLVKYDDIEGKAIFIIPKVGNILIFLQNKNIIMFIIIIYYILMLGMLYLKKSNKEV